MQQEVRILVAAALALALVAGCATRTPAPVEDRNPRTGPAAPAATLLPLPPPAAPSATESEARAQTYTVKRGDTLHGIALDHGLDYRDLVAWNGIENPNRIEVGQVLRLAPPGATPGEGGVTTAPLKSAPPVVAQPGAQGASPATAAPMPPLAGAGSRNTDNYKSQPKLFKEPYSEQALREAQRAAGVPPQVVAMNTPPAPVVSPPTPSPAPEPAPAAKSESKPTPATKSESKPEPPQTSARADDDGDRLQWAWPANGKVISGFSETSNLKGIDIGGAAGTPIVASAPGKVVYAGSGLRGYGKLIIVKHNATYLSAYAHNREILVKEGQQVVRGQKIGEMGDTDANDVKLHFEIRRLGKPVDPLKYLPPA